MTCQRCGMQHGATVYGLGRYSTATIAEIRNGVCQHCDYDEQYRGFLYRRAGDEVSADDYGVGDDFRGTMFADMEGGE
ncbi:hypothetical protein LCGC14_1605180 [marine sediment metagenome]|uniref:Uncharacterized protein n=1 Tax=marine sediment metagenome TaxID=412755 RepID=A0A0F9L9Y4_9ZZZZ